ncbi:MAG: hypothetical protein R3286_13130 [Gammaproteobacteria bacterium]|nr:hypothetical protein [Gammaproteobacteria bacterium]
MSEHDRVPPLGEIKATRRDVRERPNPAPVRESAAASGYREYDLLLRESPPRALSIFHQMLAILVRLLGLTFLVIGIGAALVILNEAWHLYKDPERIEPFAAAIERGSNLDRIFALSETDAAATQEPSESAAPERDSASLRLSYFASWFLVLLLMLVGSIVAISAVSAGGRLVLYDTDIRQLSRAVVKEVRRNRAG